MFPNNELNNDLKFVQEINEEIHADRTRPGLISSFDRATGHL